MVERGECSEGNLKTEMLPHSSQRNANLTLAKTSSDHFDFWRLRNVARERHQQSNLHVWLFRFKRIY